MVKLKNGDDEIRTHDPRLARAVLSQLSYVPESIVAMFGRQWAREDLNFRPHAYQACALAS